MRVEEQLIGTMNRLTDFEKIVVAKGDRWGERKQEDKGKKGTQRGCEKAGSKPRENEGRGSQGGSRCPEEEADAAKRWNKK